MQKQHQENMENKEGALASAPVDGEAPSTSTSNEADNHEHGGQAQGVSTRGDEDNHEHGLVESDAALFLQEQKNMENANEETIDFTPVGSHAASVRGAEDNQNPGFVEPDPALNSVFVDPGVAPDLEEQSDDVEVQRKPTLPPPLTPTLPEAVSEQPAPQFFPGPQWSNNSACSSITDADIRKDFVFEASGQQDEISTLGGHSLEPRPRPPIIPITANYDDVSTLGDSTLDPYASQRWRGHGARDAAGRQKMPHHDANQVHPPYWRPISSSDHAHEKPPPVAMVATEDTSKERDSFDETASYSRFNWRRFAYIAFFVLGPLLVGGIVVLSLLLTGHLKVDGAALNFDNTVSLEGSGPIGNDSGSVDNGIPLVPTDNESTFAPTFNMTNSSSFVPSQFPTAKPLPSEEEEADDDDEEEPQLETKDPTPSPTNRPTSNPTSQPTIRPTPRPTRQPTPQPTVQLTPQPIIVQFTPQPTVQPTNRPTRSPTSPPTAPRETPRPTRSPTPEPLPRETPSPSPQPTPDPTLQPVPDPTPRPTSRATPEPTRSPTEEPRATTERPTREPIVVPAVPLVISQPPFPEMRFVPWSDFQRRTHPQVVGATTDALEYTESTWNTPGRASVERSSYATVYRRSPLHAFALWNLGFQSSPSWNCWINHFMAFSWDEITFLPSASQADGLRDLVSSETNYGRNVRSALEVLGWTRESWANNNSSGNWPASFLRSWSGLTSTEQQAARVLCYDQALWDEDPIPNW